VLKTNSRVLFYDSAFLPFFFDEMKLRREAPASRSKIAIWIALQRERTLAVDWGRGN
jgi:hypothetical protein